jgi:Uri superfamily endonuclease
MVEVDASNAVAEVPQCRAAGQVIERMLSCKASSRGVSQKNGGELWSPPDFKSDPGTYALLLSSATDAVIRVGQLGDMQVQPGFYVYIGSALGTGGVRARLAHHMRLAERPHWHIDYLHLYTTLEEIWFCYDRKSREHEWARRFGGMRGASVSMAGFGSSDCHCESHLFFFRKRPSRKYAECIRHTQSRRPGSTLSAGG